MYDQGKVLGSCVAGVTAAVCGATVLPQTGVDTAIQLALATAAGLTAWGVVYMSVMKFGKR